MVNTGKPSRGCFACKERRVKCDLRKPSCQRCTSLKQPCPGFPDEWTVVHRRQNTYAETQVQARVEKRTQERQDKALALTRTVQFSLEIQTLAQFHCDYSSNADMKLFNAIPTSCAGDPSELCQYAVKAVALANTARQHYQPKLMIDARRNYTKAIKAANTALDDLALVEHDSLLTGLFLSGMFEIIVADQCITNIMDASTMCHPHARGALALLQFRAQRNLSSDMDKELFTFICHVTLIEIFTSPVSDMQIWYELEGFKSCWTTGVALDTQIRQALTFWTYAHTAEATTPSAQITPSELFESATLGMHIVTSLENLANQIESSAGEQNNPDQRFFNNIFSSSMQIPRIIAKTLYKAIALHILEATMRFLIKLDHETRPLSHTSDLRNQCQNKITILASEICEAIGFVFALDGREMVDAFCQPGVPYRAFWMVWPMTAILFSPFTEPSRKVWMREAVRVVGERTGMGLLKLTGVVPIMDFV